MIFLVKQGDALQAVIVARRLRKLLRRLHFILSLGDHTENIARWEDLLVNIIIPQNLLHHTLGIRRIIDCKAAVIAEAFDLAAQNAAAGAVEGHGPNALALSAQKSAQTVLQLVGGLVGKGDGDNAPGVGRMQRGKLLRALRTVRSRVLRLRLQKENILLRHMLRYLFAVRAAAETDQIRDSVDQHRCLSAARARKEQ